MRGTSGKAVAVETDGTGLEEVSYGPGPVGDGMLVDPAEFGQIRPFTVALMGGNYAIVRTDGDPLSAPSQALQGGAFKEADLGVYARRFELGDAPDNAPTPIGGDVLVFDEFGVPLVAALTGGGYALAYVFSVSGTITGFQTQAFTNDGTPLGDPVYLGLFEISGSDNDPSIAALSGGGYVLGWVGQDADDESINPALFQRFDATGQPVGPRVTLSTDAGSFDTKIAAAPDGGFFVLWGAEATEGMFGQRYDAQGNAVGAQIDFPQFTSREPSVKFLSNGNLAIARGPLVGPLELAIYSPTGTLLTVSASQNAGRSPQIAVLEGGGFVLTWEAVGDIMAQLFDDQAVAQGAAFRVNSDAIGDRDFPSIQSLADGGFIVSWESSLQDGDPFDLYARQFAADGRPVGDEFIVNATREGMQRGDFENVTQLANGDLLFTWWIEDGPDAGVYLRRFLPDVPPPTAIGDEVRIFDLEGTTELSGLSLVVGLAGGGFAVAYLYSFDDENGLFATRVFAADGTPTGDLVQLGSFQFASEENYPSIAALPDGGYVLGWTSDPSGGDDPAVLQRFDGNGVPVGGRVTLTADATTYDTTVVEAPDGGFLVLWGTASSNGMVGQRYDAQGSPFGTLFQFPTFSARMPAVTFLSDGNIAIAHEPPSGPIQILLYGPTGTLLATSATQPLGSSPQIAALEDGGFAFAYELSGIVMVQIFNAAAVAQGAAFRVDPASGFLQGSPDLQSLAGGGFVVSWGAVGQDGDGNGLYARLFAADGQPASDAFLVNRTTQGEQNPGFNSVTQLADGDLLFTWWGDGVDGPGVYTRRFDVPGAGGEPGSAPTPGDDDLTGTPGADLFDLSQGGNDIVDGGAGDDGFFFGRAYTGADTVDGGAGALDQIGLQGDYSGGVTLGSLLNTELLVLLAGNDARFGGATGTDLSYAINVDGGTIVSDNKLTIQANLLRAGEGLIFNGGGSAIDFLIFGGAGTDILTGGSGNDGFFFGQGRFGASDVVNGGAGTMDQLGLQGDYSGANAVTFGAAQLSGLEFIVLLSASDNRFGATGGVANYDLTTNDSNVDAGQTLIVSATTLKPGENASFDGSAEISGRFEIYSGAGNDVLRGGAGNDLIFGGGSGDTMTGGGGNDVFGYNAITDSDQNERDGIGDFDLGDRIDLSRIDANSNLAGVQGFTFVGTNAFSGQAGELRYQNVGGNLFEVLGDTNGDGVADLDIFLVISDGHTLTLADFIGATAPQAGLLGPATTVETDAATFAYSDAPGSAKFAGAEAGYLDFATAQDFSRPDFVHLDLHGLGSPLDLVL